MLSRKIKFICYSPVMPTETNIPVICSLESIVKVTCHRFDIRSPRLTSPVSHHRVSLGPWINCSPPSGLSSANLTFLFIWHLNPCFSIALIASFILVPMGTNALTRDFVDTLSEPRTSSIATLVQEGRTNKDVERKMKPRTLCFIFHDQYHAHNA